MSLTPFYPPNRSSSFDGTVRVWDPVTGKARLTLTPHSAMVYALAFSPSGEFVASTSTDRLVAVHSTSDGSLVRTYVGPAAGFDVAWAPEGNRLAACFASGAVALIDVRV